MPVRWMPLPLVLLLAACSGGDPAKQASLLAGGDEAAAREAAEGLREGGLKSLPALRTLVRGTDAAARDRALEVARALLDERFEGGWAGPALLHWLDNDWPAFPSLPPQPFGEYVLAVLLDGSGTRFEPRTIRGEPVADLESAFLFLKKEWPNSGNADFSGAAFLVAAAPDTPWGRVEEVLRSALRNGGFMFSFAVEGPVGEEGLPALRFYLTAEDEKARKRTDIVWMDILERGGTIVYRAGGQEFGSEEEAAAFVRNPGPGKKYFQPRPAAEVPLQAVLSWHALVSRAQGTPLDENTHLVYEIIMRKE